MPTRDSWDQYFMNMAKMAATRATCDRKHVGVVLVQNKSVIATGYNGSMPGADHCDEVGHLMEDGHCVATVHAEVNAIAQAARNGHPTDGATAYVTAFPCWGCFKALVSAGIDLIVYAEAYRPDQKVIDHAAALNVDLVALT